MNDHTTIRQELDQIAAMLDGLRGSLPAPYTHALSGNEWLRDQIPAGAMTPAARPRWVPAVAAASLTAGLFTSPPGYALPASALAGAADLGGLIPPPPVVLAPGAALQQGARFLTNLAANQVLPAPKQVMQPAQVEAQGAKPAVAFAAENASALAKVDLPFATDQAAQQPADPAARQPADPAAQQPALPDGAAGSTAQGPEPLPADPAIQPLGEKAAAPVDLPFKSQLAKPAHPHVETAPAHTIKPQPRVDSSRTARPGPKIAKKAAPSKNRTLAPSGARQALRWHTIKPGETLIKLARQYYQGTGSHWKGIFAFNKSRLEDANRVFPGDQIVIPSLAEAIAAERGQVPYVAAHAAPRRIATAADHKAKAGRWRHKTRIAHRDPILKPRPGVPI